MLTNTYTVTKIRRRW